MVPFACVVKAFAKEGAKVIATDISESKLRELEEYSGKCFTTDISPTFVYFVSCLQKFHMRTVQNSKGSGNCNNVSDPLVLACGLFYAAAECGGWVLGC